MSADNESVTNSTGGGGGDSQQKGSEDRKIFVGGISAEVTNTDLEQFFAQYGEVRQAQVKIDRTTGRSRGFAFVEFAGADACKAALSKREQMIKNKPCEVKPAKSRENKKVFVGGLPADHPEEELRKYFEQFGKVDDVEWPYDKTSKIRRNFAFIVFEEEDAADRAAANPKHTFGERECDVKKAVPQNRRFNPRFGGPMGGAGPMRGGYGMRPMHTHGGASGGPWFGAGGGGWNQMHGMYGGGGAAAGGGGANANAWGGEWFSGGNYYGAGGHGYGGGGGGGGGAYNRANQYDYNVMNGAHGRHQNGAVGHRSGGGSGGNSGGNGYPQSQY